MVSALLARAVAATAVPAGSASPASAMNNAEHKRPIVMGVLHMGERRSGSRKTARSS
jgi:hypothetical protein